MNTSSRMVMRNSRLLSTRVLSPGKVHWSHKYSSVNQEIAKKTSSIPVRRRRRIIVGVTGATGAPLAVTLLQQLWQRGIEVHLILSKWGTSTLKHELDAPENTRTYLESFATKIYSHLDVSATISSGSFRTDGMIILPCSMKTLAAVRNGYDNDLIARAAGVTLKERRRLVLAVRETPLSSIYLENMLEVTRAGAIVFPPVMAFYSKPDTVQDMIDHLVRRMLDSLDIRSEDEEVDDEGRWSGFSELAARTRNEQQKLMAASNQPLQSG